MLEEVTQHSIMSRLCLSRHNYARDVAASSALVCDQPRLGSNGNDRDDLPHRAVASTNAALFLTKVRHKPLVAQAHSCARQRAGCVNGFSLCRQLSAYCTPIMPIRPYLDGHRFDPETVRLLGIAFETALQALRSWGSQRRGPMRFSSVSTPS